jgi:hypothetical protein
MRHLPIAVVAIAAALVLASSVGAQQPIAPVDFRPFVDGHNWIVRQPLTYRIGVSNDSITVPAGFVTDLASIPPVLQSIIQQNGPYLLPAVVHDYLYWKQACTRKQSDQILLFAMIENRVKDFHRDAIYGAVRAAGGIAWDRNASERSAHLIRILPADRVNVDANTLWSEYQRRLTEQGIADGPDTPIPGSFCARGDMSPEDALRTR